MRHVEEKLERYYEEVSRIILIPASVAVTAHGDYRDAWVRDNVYSILAVWSLGLAYRRLDDDKGRAYELEHATIKCMRGLLFSMMRQVHKVELFKGTQALDQALHAKYNTSTGDTVVADNAWGHLQLDATAIFVLFLAQMTVSGLHIIYTTDEVQFIQNLVFYMERAYRTPDFGVWERGNKSNHGEPELNCSSIGMVVAALQSINGINLFGSRGGPSSVIHVLPDEIARNSTTLHSALPRESGSKEIDASLLAVISFPAFAVRDVDLVRRTRSDIIKKLGGQFGCKRFLRDGHQTVLEDHKRLHYEPHELKVFESVESEWPLFFTYLILDGLFLDDPKQVKHYRSMLDPLLVNSNTVDMYKDESETGYENEDHLKPMRLVPELYIVPRESIEEERKNPGSQERVPNQNVPLVWAQSLYIMGNLIHDGLLSIADVDPLGRRLQAALPKNDTVVQIVLMAESEELQARLLMYGLQTFTKENCEPITISKPSCLRDAYTFLGKNEKLGLSGRPARPMGTLSTCKIYRCRGQLYAFQPHFMDKEEFYLVSDNDYLVSLFEQEISSVKNLWTQTGRPTMVVMLTKQMFNLNPNQAPKRNLLNFLISIGSAGICHGTRVRVGRLSEMINTACIESLDFLTGDEDFNFILSGKRTRVMNNLKMDSDHSLSLNRGRSIRTMASREEDTFESLKSPLYKSRGYSPTLAEVDPTEEGHVILTDRQTLSPSQEQDDAFFLKLSDPSQTDEAIKLLANCANLYDQVDLLHYLYSCHGPDYIVKDNSSITILLDEVYLKAMQYKQWSIVRQAAGILKKTVNSLTSNLTDLLVRQKPVTIGIRPNEYLLDSPKNPAALASIIFENCKSDVREAPLIQEVITYLGQIIRSSPQVFSGIMRIRTHFFVIAMREEICRSSKCDEEEAIEQLMRLSPYEMKSLLQQVLVAHDQMENVKLSGSSKAVAEVVQKRVIEGKLHLSVQSAGYNAGNFADFSISKFGVGVEIPLIPGRGLNMIALDPYSGNIIDSANFDINLSTFESDHFAKLIMDLDKDVIVLLSGKDEFVDNITEAALVACESLGSALIRNVQYRDSWCLIGIKGAKIGSVFEAHRAAQQGPTEKLSQSINLADISKIARKGSFGGNYMPSNGWWIRRRRNDGALNRVPLTFYPKVWSILSKVEGLAIGPTVLCSNPTISESTPEELNFALQVENLLDNFIDPAEHQIAVECLVVISRIEEKNAELTLIKGRLDLKKVISDAIQAFWDKWIREQGNESSVTPLMKKGPLLKKVIDSAVSPLAPTLPIHSKMHSDPIALSNIQSVSRHFGEMKIPSSSSSLHVHLEDPTVIKQGTDLSFETNDRLARRIFFDLKQDGLDGTMSFLASACLKIAFGVPPSEDSAALYDQ